MKQMFLLVVPLKSVQHGDSDHLMHKKHHKKKGSEVIAWLCRPHTYRRAHTHTQQSLCTMCCHIFFFSLKLR